MLLGLDIGGSFIKAGLVEKGKVIKHTTCPTPRTREALLKGILTLLGSLGRADGLGVAVPGPADYAQGKILSTPNLPLRNFQLRQYLESKTRLPVRMQNDAVCFTLGEALYGAGRGKQVVVGVTLGTGLGGGIVIHGKAFTGRGNAGHFSMMVLDKAGVKHSHFKYGTFELACSERGLLSRAEGFTSGLELHNAAIRGEKVALSAFSSYGHDLGLGLGGIIACLDPDIVILGGGLANAYNLFSRAMEKARRAVCPFGAEIVKARLPNSAILGAASLFA